MLWPFLFVGQLIAVCLAVLIAGMMFDTRATPPLWTESLFALVGIPLATGAHFVQLLRYSGYWIWVPGVADIAYDVYLFGMGSVAGDPMGALIAILTASCAVYSLTLVCLTRWNSWLHRQFAH